ERVHWSAHADLQRLLRSEARPGKLLHSFIRCSVGLRQLEHTMLQLWDSREPTDRQAPVRWRNFGGTLRSVKPRRKEWKLLFCPLQRVFSELFRSKHIKHIKEQYMDHGTDSR